MAPSQVNDSARAEMARLAEFRDDISGAITTGGTSTAYTLTSNQVFDTLAHANGAMMAFVPHTTCGATVTLAVDSIGAKPLRSAPSVELPSGTLIQGTPYVATYNNSDGVWYLQGFYVNPFTIPIGGVLPYVGASAPSSSFAFMFGQAIDRTTYATLFALISTNYGIGNGSTTFNIPDLRGRAVFGLDNMGGSAASRITVAGGNFDGTLQTSSGAGGAQNKVIANGNLPASIPLNDPGHTHIMNARSFGDVGVLAATSGSINGVFDLGTSGSKNSGILAASTGITINPGGANTALPIMPPAIVLPYILRII